jgi:hypothetical protein
LLLASSVRSSRQGQLAMSRLMMLPDKSPWSTPVRRSVSRKGRLTAAGRFSAQ